MKNNYQFIFQKMKSDYLFFGKKQLEGQTTYLIGPRYLFFFKKKKSDSCFSVIRRANWKVETPWLLG
jgi:hypothetical protein